MDGRDGRLEAVGGEPALGLLGRARLECTSSTRPPGCRCSAARSQMRSRNSRPSGPASHARASPRGGVAGRRRDVGRVGDDEVEAAPATGAKRSPRSTSSASRLRRAFSRALITARRLRSTAVARAPSRAAVSAEDAGAGAQVEHRTPGQIVPRHDPAEQGGVAGRAQDPGEDDDAHAPSLPTLRARQSPRWVASAHGRTAEACARSSTA